MRIFSAFGAILLMLVTTVSGAAAGGSLLLLFGAEWTTFRLPDKAEAEFLDRNDGSVEVRAAGAVGFLYREVAADDVVGSLSWRWRVDRAIPATDLSRRGRDDRPLAVHLWFRPLPAQESFWGSIGELFGAPVPGYALTYVWGGSAARGERFANPYFDDGVIVVLRSGTADTGKWYEERVDIGADFKRIFGIEAPDLAYIAISADTDDLGGESIGRIADMRLRPTQDGAPTHGL